MPPDGKPFPVRAGLPLSESEDAAATRKLDRHRLRRKSTPRRFEARLFGSMLPYVSDPKARVDAKNRDFIRFEQVDKKQEYRLAEARDGEQLDTALRIPNGGLG